MMKRREFITLLGGAAAAWPLAAGEGVRRVGALMNLTADDVEASARVTALAQGLQQLGWTVGRNLRIDYRWGAMDADRARRYAPELVALAPDVILAVSAPAVVALQQAARAVPMVFVNIVDPVGAGSYMEQQLLSLLWLVYLRGRPGLCGEREAEHLLPRPLGPNCQLLVPY
jgi:ABC-type uncharacterized transport system substrate-binding protein